VVKQAPGFGVLDSALLAARSADRYDDDGPSQALIARIVTDCSPAEKSTGILHVEVTHVIGDSSYTSVPSLATIYYRPSLPRVLNENESPQPRPVSVFYSLGTTANPAPVSFRCQ
jgi:hypothetical protein